MVHKKIDLSQLSPAESLLTPIYAARGLANAVSKYEIPETEMLPAIAIFGFKFDGHSGINCLTACCRGDSTQEALRIFLLKSVA